MLPFSCYAIVAPGLEAITARELEALGLVPDVTEPGGVEFQATREQLYAANLRLRTASRIVVRIARFHARTFFELERHAARVPWAEFMAPGAAVAFHVTSRKSKLYHHGAIEERLARAATGRGSEPGGPSALFVVRVLRDQVTISADSSGELLHRRGYRQATAKAPLRETLAAAMLLASGWDGVAPLVDPFAGSGTIPIEAALIARRIAPGLQRRFAFEHWPRFDAAAWERVRARAASEVLAAAPGPIIGADRDAGAIRAATGNAERAGVSADVEWRRAPLSTLAPPRGRGWLITNPPYGVRVGERRRLDELYAELGAIARERLAGWTLGLLSASRELEARTGLALAEAWHTTNGGIPVRLMTGTVPEPG